MSEHSAAFVGEVDNPDFYLGGPGDVKTVIRCLVTINRRITRLAHS